LLQEPAASPVLGSAAQLGSSLVQQAWLDELSEFIRIPSVSADPRHANDVRRAGEWVCEFIRDAGGEATLEDGTTSPLALGEIQASNGAAKAPTVLVYGHFDVQPPAPVELWESDPFELTIRDEWVFGRGIADDKGQLYLLLRAARELAAEGTLPVNVRVACDGEEETGGHSIVDFLASDDRGADACVIFDSGMTKRDVPEFDVGTRGLVAFDVRVQTGEKDLHSGVYGNAALNAIHALIQSLAALLPREGRLPEPLRDGIIPLTDEERESLKELVSGAEMLADAGARPYDESAAEEFYVRTWSESSVDVNGILGGKPGLRNTTIPATAQANFTIRLAPGQEVDRIGNAAEQLLRQAAPNGAELEIEWDGNPAGLVSPDSPAVQLGLDAFERALGKRPLLVRSGGTLPIIPALADNGIPTILTGFALLESNIHSPNERMLVDYFPLGVRAARELFTAFAELR
jgi:acetylornithine deacetylase/succinyl-diaminopimelate desuccinylase-like protein